MNATANTPSTDLPAIVTEPFECHDPLGRTDYLSREHVERYRFAVGRLTAGMHVLDIACGAGYGSEMLGQAGMDVTGGDYDARAVERAARWFPARRFTQADARQLPFDDARFDAVVTFETIEHVHDGTQFLGEMLRVLKPGGVLISSTPNITYTAHPDFHVKEYEPEEYFALVERHLERVERHAQYIGLGDRLLDLYAWKLQPHVLAVADRTGARPLLKKTLLKKAPLAASPQSALDPTSEALARAARIREFLASDPDADHRVVDYAGPRMCRIMITVAHKPESAR